MAQVRYLNSPHICCFSHTFFHREIKLLSNKTNSVFLPWAILTAGILILILNVYVVGRYYSFVDVDSKMKLIVFFLVPNTFRHVHSRNVNVELVSTSCKKINDDTCHLNLL